MKLFFTSLILCLTAFTAVANFNDDADMIAAAFKKGSAEEVAKYFNSSIDMTTPTGTGMYSKEQAKMVLVKFFGANTPTSARVIHRGTSGSGANFIVIELGTSGGSYRVNVFMKQEAGGSVIQELKIEK